MILRFSAMSICRSFTMTAFRARPSGIRSVRQSSSGGIVMTSAFIPRIASRMTSGKDIRKNTTS
jgi:hypothetical protein